MRSPDEVERDIDRLALVVATTSASCDEIIDSGRLSKVHEKNIREIRDCLIETAAFLTRSARKNAQMDAVLFGNPDVIEAAILDRLTPGQCAQLAQRLTN